jgi:LysM repeat protein
MKINWGTGTEMTQRACGMAIILALLSIASTAMSQQYYLYSPKEASTEAKANKANGEILVSEIVIKKGDTLSGISRKFSGKGSYYPQILLFNDIKNPNLIRTGDSLRVPVKKEFAGVTESKSRTKLTVKKSVPENKKKVAITPSSPASDTIISVKPVKIEKPVSAVQKTDEQQLFDKAFNAYSSGNCVAAIAMFDKILSANPDNSFAADATLYKADCLLKMSGQ